MKFSSVLVILSGLLLVQSVFAGTKYSIRTIRQKGITVDIKLLQGGNLQENMKGYFLERVNSRRSESSKLQPVARFLVVSTRNEEFSCRIEIAAKGFRPEKISYISMIEPLSPGPDFHVDKAMKERTGAQSDDNGKAIHEPVRAGKEIIPVGSVDKDVKDIAGAEQSSLGKSSESVASISLSGKNPDARPPGHQQGDQISGQSNPPERSQTEAGLLNVPNEKEAVSNPREELSRSITGSALSRFVEQASLKKPYVSLRYEYAGDISKKTLRSVVARKGLRDRYLNRSGNIPNNFHSYDVGSRAIVIDTATGLMWLSSGSPRSMTISRVQTWLHQLNAEAPAGFNDWRLPTVEEALSLVEEHAASSSKGPRGVRLFLNPIFSFQQPIVWTGDQVRNDVYWIVSFEKGFAEAHNYLGFRDEYHVFPVRRIQPINAR